ncbi:MAG TPA: bifunctional phosphopantothenoylcysteine decarboxylase/phosphopantothenate--cysteine ligase CoaBC [Archaeoglobaceae archaeon]|nr:bifunctional phosphopantothenoylcysteine decarboxylase/phosphopantothenate--cysteine ligase CoaBC [Archaeoglobaceae archaeon]
MHLEKIRGTESKKLERKKILLAVTGSIAAIESIKLSRELIRRGAEVTGVMSEDAKKIINPYALEFATDRIVTEITGKIEHVNFVEISDLLLVAPASANTISRIANGISDNAVTLFSTSAIGKIPVIIVPAMSESMIENPFIRENISKLKNNGIEVVEPVYEEKKAKFPPVDLICLYVERALYKKEMEGKRVIVTSGPTFEHIDPIRFISNRSSGLMGKELAFEFWRRGAEVIHITSKPTGLRLYDFTEVVVRSVNDMLYASLNEVRKGCDLFVSSAAPSDFTVEKAEDKMKTSDEITLKLRAAPKIIKELRKIYEGTIIGFKAETGVSDEELYRIAYEKMVEDRLQMVVANDVKEKGMGTEDTRVLLLTEKREEWAEGSKVEVAERIVRAYLEDCP